MSEGPTAACSIDGCDRRRLSKGYCAPHYHRARRGGNMTTPIGWKPPKQRCSVESCNRTAILNGMCPPHDARAKEGRDLSAPLRRYVKQGPVCLANGCENPPRARGLCVSCYANALVRSQINPSGKRCRALGCSGAVRSKGMCSYHHARSLRGVDVDAPRERRPKGSGAFDRNGYVRIVLPDGTTRAQHRLVMEQVIGRELYPWENVHHINGVRADNRPQNLELWAKPQPNGQRVEDLVRWVVEHYPIEVRALLATEGVTAGDE